eukprot:CFRG6619T1
MLLKTQSSPTQASTAPLSKDHADVFSFEFTAKKKTCGSNGYCQVPCICNQIRTSMYPRSSRGRIRSPLLRHTFSVVNGEERKVDSQYLVESSDEETEDSERKFRPLLSPMAVISRSYMQPNSRNLATVQRDSDNVTIIQRQVREKGSEWKSKGRWITDVGVKLVGTPDPTLWAPVKTQETDENGWVYGTGSTRIANVLKMSSSTAESSHTLRYRKWYMQTYIEQSTDLQPIILSTELETKYLILSVLRGYDLAKIGGLHRMYKIAKKHEPLYEAFFKDLSPSSPEDQSEENILINDEITNSCMVAIHAKGVYGVPQERMYLNGVSGFVKMKLKQNLTDSQTESPKKNPEKWEDKNLQSCLRMTGLNSEDMLTYSWIGSTHCPAYYVCVDKRLKAIVIAIRGTVSTGDMLTDATTKAMPFLNGHIHSGFKIAMERVLGEGFECIIDAILRHPSYKLLVTGHSLGAGCAASGALLLVEDFNRVYDTYVPEKYKGNVDVREKAKAKMTKTIAYAYATPTMTTLPLAKLAEKCVITVVYKKDIVPRTGMPQLDYLLTEMQDGERKTPTAKEFYERYTPDQRMVPAGRIYQLWKAGNGINETLDLGDYGDMLVAQTDPRFYTRILFSKNMVFHHILDNYISGMMQHCIRYVKSKHCPPVTKELWISLMPFLQPSLDWKTHTSSPQLYGNRTSKKLNAMSSKSKDNCSSPPTYLSPKSI